MQCIEQKQLRTSQSRPRAEAAASVDTSSVPRPVVVLEAADAVLGINAFALQRRDLVLTRVPAAAAVSASAAARAAARSAASSSSRCS